MNSCANKFKQIVCSVFAERMIWTNEIGQLFSFFPSLLLALPCCHFFLMSKLLVIKTFTRVSIRLCERRASALLSWYKSQIKIKTNHTTLRKKWRNFNEKMEKKWKQMLFLAFFMWVFIWKKRFLFIESLLSDGKKISMKNRKKRFDCEINAMISTESYQDPIRKLKCFCCFILLMEFDFSRYSSVYSPQEKIENQILLWREWEGEGLKEEAKHGKERKKMSRKWFLVVKSENLSWSNDTHTAKRREGHKKTLSRLIFEQPQKTAMKSEIWHQKERHHPFAFVPMLYLVRAKEMKFAYKARTAVVNHISIDRRS